MSWGQRLRGAASIVLMATAAMMIMTGCGSAPEMSPREKARIDYQRYMANTRESLKAYRAAFRLADRADVLIGRMTYALEGAEDVARLYRLASARDSEAAIRQRMARPPKSLKRVNAAVARQMDQVSNYRDDISAAFASRNVSRIQSTLRRGMPSWDIRTRWRNDVAAYARSLGLDIPPWFRPVGKTRTPRV